MAYFFAVLRDLCGLRDKTGSQTSESAVLGERGQQSESTGKGQDRPMVSARQLWQAALAELQNVVPAQSFNTWLKNTSIAAFDNATITIAVPSNFAKEWIETRYGNQIAETLHNVIGYKVEVCFAV
jgi:hypothetical protein